MLLLKKVSAKDRKSNRFSAKPGLSFFVFLCCFLLYILCGSLSYQGGTLSYQDWYWHQIPVGGSLSYRVVVP